MTCVGIDGLGSYTPVRQFEMVLCEEYGRRPDWGRRWKG